MAWREEENGRFEMFLITAPFSRRHPPRRHNDCITKNLGEVVKRVQGRAPEEAMVALALDNEFFRILTLQTTQPAAWY